MFVSSPHSADSAGPDGAVGAPGRSAVIIANPGKHVIHSHIDAESGFGIEEMSNTAPVPLASASIPVVPAKPAIEMSLAALGAVRATNDAITANSAELRRDVESHC